VFSSFTLLFDLPHTTPTHYLIPTTHYPLPTTHHSLPTTHYPRTSQLKQRSKLRDTNVDYAHQKYPILYQKRVLFEAEPMREKFVALVHRCVVCVCVCVSSGVKCIHVVFAHNNSFFFSHTYTLSFRCMLAGFHLPPTITTRVDVDQEGVAHAESLSFYPGEVIYISRPYCGR
jgi:hypothetical protein